MSYRNAEKALLLVLWLQGSRHGLTLDELADRLGTSRRSVQRLMALLRGGEMGTAGLALIEDEVWQRPTRYRIATRPLRALLSMTEGEMSALDKAVAALRAWRMAGEAGELARLAAKVRALADDAELDALEAEVAYRTEARSFATRPGPRNPLDARIVGAIERAIADLSQIRFRYRRVDGSEDGERVMCPFGIVIGKFHYLIAFDAERGAGAAGEHLRTYRIDRMSAAEVLDRPFVRPERPTVAEFARKSFGIYQEPPRRVRWRFSAAKAEEAAGFVFHPTQTLTREPGGTLLVEFEAGGLKEMAWELFQWDGEVEILDPPELKAVMAEQIALARRMLGG
jgi:predicted DNA-binding transcriptional regulator YafY